MTNEEIDKLFDSRDEAVRVLMYDLEREKSWGRRFDEKFDLLYDFVIEYLDFPATDEARES